MSLSMVWIESLSLIMRSKRRRQFIPSQGCPKLQIYLMQIALYLNQLIICVFRLKLDKESGQPKGFGFVEYRTEDLASSALRNLNKYELNRRELKVDYASDGKNGVNLRAEDVRGRDQGEIIEETPSKGIVMPSQVSMHQLYWREIRGPQAQEQAQTEQYRVRGPIYYARGSLTTYTEGSLPRHCAPGFPHKVLQSMGSSKPNPLDLVTTAAQKGSLTHHLYRQYIQVLYQLGTPAEIQPQVQNQLRNRQFVRSQSSPGPYSSEMDTFNRTDLIKCLTNSQEMMILQAIKDVYEQTVKQEPQAVERLVEILANDEVALETLSKILDRHLSAQGYKK